MRFQRFIPFVIHLFHKLGIGITTSANLETLNRKQTEYDLVQSNLANTKNDLVLILELSQMGLISSQHYEDLIIALNSSKSALRQEVFCLIYNN